MNQQYCNRAALIALTQKKIAENQDEYSVKTLTSFLNGLEVEYGSYVTLNLSNESDAEIAYLLDATFPANRYPDGVRPKPETEKDSSGIDKPKPIADIHITIIGNSLFFSKKSRVSSTFLAEKFSEFGQFRNEDCFYIDIDERYFVAHVVAYMRLVFENNNLSVYVKNS